MNNEYRYVKTAYCCRVHWRRVYHKVPIAKYRAYKKQLADEVIAANPHLVWSAELRGALNVEIERTARTKIFPSLHGDTQ